MRSSPGPVWPGAKGARLEPTRAEPGRARARRVRRLRRHFQGAQHPAHAADVRHQRDPRDRAAGRADRARPRRRRRAEQDPGRDRHRVRHDQRRRRVPGHRPDALDVQGEEAGGRPMSDFIAILYIIAFALFIYGLMGLTGPRTAVRGNWIAAVGMGIAVLATLLTPGMGNWLLIVL